MSGVHLIAMSRQLTSSNMDNTVSTITKIIVYQSINKINIKRFLFL